MFGVLLFVIIFVSILLVVAVLMQSSKGGGLAGSLGGSSMGTVFGVRRTADFLSKATMYLATIFLVLCLIINIFFLPGKSRTTESVIQRGAASSTPLSSPPPTGQPAAPQQGQAK